MRRLPIYFLIDTSESMVGEPIQAVEAGLAMMFGILRKNPYALETAYISIITFGTVAKQLVPLTELSQFQMPKLVLGSGTSLGAGLELLEKRLASEVQKSTAEVKGDYRPLVFLMTDGEPTDRWQAVADRFMHNRHVQLIAIGCGPDTNLDTLRRTTEIVIVGAEANSQTYKDFFQWISTSVVAVSQAIDQTGNDTLVSLEKLPVGSDIQIVDQHTPQPPIEPNRFVFLHCKCVKTKKFYLLKFVKDGKDHYIRDGAFALDDFEKTDLGGGVNIEAGSLVDNTPCPYCSSPLWAKCSCGKTHCCPNYVNQVTLTCPWCGTTDTYAASSFSVGGGGG